MTDKQKIEKLEADLDDAHRIIANMRNKIQPLATLVDLLEEVEDATDDYPFCVIQLNQHLFEFKVKTLNVLIDAVSDSQEYPENHPDHTWGRN